MKNSGQAILTGTDALSIQRKLTIPLLNVAVTPVQPKGSIVYDLGNDVVCMSNGEEWIPVITLIQPGHMLMHDRSMVSIKDSGVVFSLNEEKKMEITEKGVLSVGGENPEEGVISHFQGNVKIDGDVKGIYTLFFENGSHLYTDEAGQLIFKNEKGESVLNGASSEGFTRKYYNTALGKESLQYVSGDGNTAFGSYCLQYATSSRNTGYGSFTLQNTVEGEENVGLGYMTMHQNEKGSYNTAVGTFSIKESQRSFHNTAIGYRTLEKNREGNYNTVLGAEALGNALYSFSNIAIGKALTECTQPGIQNIAIGQKSLHHPDFIGMDNIMIGTNTGKALQQGKQNIAIGPSALDESATCDSNIAIGANALGSGNISSEQIAIGLDALTSNVSGHENTAVGTRSLCWNVSGCGNTMVGYESMPFGVDAMDNVGMGAFSLFGNKGGSGNIAIGKESLQNLEDGSGNIAIGKGAGGGIKVGSGNIFIGEETTGKEDVKNSIVIGSGGKAEWDHQFILHGKMSDMVSLKDGAVKVECPWVTTNTRILAMCQYPKGVPGFLYVSDRIEKESFTIKSSSNYDESIIAYFLFDP